MGNQTSVSSINEDQSKPLLSDTDQYSRKQDKEKELDTIIYQANSFVAVLWPVTLTMIFSSIVTCYLHDEQTKANMSSYLYYKNIDNSVETNAIKTMQAIINALIIIAFIAFVTFLVVLLYKFNCMKGLIGYLMLSSCLLLAITGSTLLQTILLRFESVWDKCAFFLIMYNFSVVGTISIFYQKGIPSLVEKGYLIITSVLMAWQLCQWPDWSAWTILCLLAAWDLFAVLAPCGPLRWLVSLIHSEGRPMPGLLYEARVMETHLSHDESNSLEMAPMNSSCSSQLESNPSLLLLKNKKLADLERQLAVFYDDYSPESLYKVHLVAEYYLDRENELWPALYDKYDVTHTRTDRPYPHHSVVRSMRKREESADKNTIKLGLGDFIFYSLLVGKAALYDFSTFASCLLSIIVGLAITLYLLAKFNALPALPISIVIAVVCFFWTSSFATPFIRALGTTMVMG